MPKWGVLCSTLGMCMIAMCYVECTVILGQLILRYALPGLFDMRMARAHAHASHAHDMRWHVPCDVAWTLPPIQLARHRIISGGRRITAHVGQVGDVIV